MQPGLRERKKARTRAAIQRHALRLFREQGYEETTVSQIAAAAVVSESTFFRYFPTKEDVVLWDEFDPMLLAAFEAQPPGLSPIAAMRGAFRAVFGGISAEQQADIRERTELFFAVPELRAAAIASTVDAVVTVSALVARRTGRAPDDIAVRTFAGAVLGAMIAGTISAVSDPESDFVGLLDAALGHLEAGLPL